MKTIKISKDFSETPGTRFKDESTFSGEEFRENIFYPAWVEAIQNGEKIIIDLDGTAGYATSFIDEVFGGMIDEHKIHPEELFKNLVIISREEPIWIAFIVDVINWRMKWMN